MSGAELLTNSLLDRAFAAAHRADDCNAAAEYGEEIQRRIGQGVFTIGDFPLYAGLKNSPMKCAAIQNNPVVIYGIIALVLILLWGAK